MVFFKELVVLFCVFKFFFYFCLIFFFLSFALLFLSSFLKFSFLELLSGRFDTSESMIPCLVTEISPCDGFCDERRGGEQELGILGARYIRC